MSYIVKIDDKEFKLNINREGDYFKIFLNNKEIEAKIASEYHNSQLSLIINNKMYNIIFESDNKITVNEEEYKAEIFDEQIHKLIKTSPEVALKKELTITVPMPGLVIEIEVKEGDSVMAEQGLIVVEAMKMQNEIKAPRDGVVKKILVKKGQTVNSRETLIVIE